MTSNPKCGIVPDMKRYEDEQHKVWAKEVKERDGYRCDACKSVNQDAHAHHLFDYKTHEPERYLLTNGITLCPKCHDRFHKWNGGCWRACTPKRYYKWLEAMRGAKKMPKKKRDKLRFDPLAIGGTITVTFDASVIRVR